ncbi:MAG: carbohydrate binding family 9 domain-containing protein [Flavobacteriaceae bacterium]|nr:carbohydrate binding family 9 domain-containing protein [Bacteroidia bacterium]NNK86747.1 carbohydrate binding family 9 domain-containing protein [Flavobacteriaceae bacterium]
MKLKSLCYNGFSVFFIGVTFLFINQTFAQSDQRPTIASGELTEKIDLDGALDEADWKNAPVLSDLLTTVPIEKGKPSFPTLVRVIADERMIYIGIDCKDSKPERIVKFSKIRDADIEEEDHIRLVLDPFMDGQSGFVFAVNAYGARYDALVSNRGESENEDWDAVWNARTLIYDGGWSVEIELPIQSITYKKGLTEWGFNIERRIQRNLETIRWANVQRDQWLTQTSRAGILTNLPEFNYGLGLNIRPSLVTELNKAGEDEPTDFNFDGSLDVNQRLSPNVLATLTVNTDFAETEVDTRQTNLTRFPLFFPEKRTFFLEGSDIFEFGFGTGRSTVLPFFSRRIGLIDNNEIPIIAGVKMNGRVGKTAFGGLGIHTKETETPDETYDASTMGVVRVRRNILKESSFGIIGSIGDPLGRNGSWMSGADFTYQTTRFNGDKNFIAGIWGMYTGREDLTDDSSAFGFKVDYPNDRWDAALVYSRIGEDFDPSLGFVPRKGIEYYRIGTTFAPRPNWPWLRQMFNQLFVTYIKTLNGPWQSYSIFTAPINWRLESGERVEFNIRPAGENLLVPFEIADGVEIPAGEYNFMRYRLEAEIAAKRKLNGQISWWFGSFYEGNLDEIRLRLNWNPTPLLGFEFSGLHNSGRLPWGDFDQTLAGLRVRFNVTSDLQLNSYMQYDTDSRNLGINARIHWIFSPLGDVFFVFNNNSFNQPSNGWQLQTRQFLLKIRYNFRL